MSLRESGLRPARARHPRTGLAETRKGAKAQTRKSDKVQSRIG